MFVTNLFNLAFRDAKRTLPRPKVGDFCSTAMEQGFSDACVALCMEQQPVNRIAQTCRAAAIEMPRPTVRKWCEHGYNVAFKKTIEDLHSHFKPLNEPALEEVYTEPIEVPVVADEVRVKTHRHVEPEESADQQGSSSRLRGGNNAATSEEEGDGRPIQATIPITMDDQTHDLVVYEGQNPEEAVVIFCRQHSADDVSTCIRHLLSVVIEKLDELKTAGL